MFLQLYTMLKRCSLVILLININAFSQNRMTALPSEETINNNYCFDIPAFGDIDFFTTSLKRYVFKNEKREDITTYYEAYINQQKNGRSKIRGGDTVNVFKLNYSKLYKNKPSVINITLQKRDDNEKKEYISFYTTESAKTENKYGKIPKMLVSYVYKSNFKTGKGQTFYSSQHDNFLDWEFSSAFTALAKNKEFNITGAGRVSMLFYNNNPIVVSSKNELQQYNTKGALLWSIKMLESPACTPVIDNNGYLYYFSHEQLEVVNLETKQKEVVNHNTEEKNIRLDKLFMVYEKSINSKKSTNIKQEITMGYDGTMYVTTDNGIEALSGYPSLKSRWFYMAGKSHTLGQLSLSKDETMAFLLDLKGGYSNLLVLNNDDGSVLFRSLTKHTNYKNDKNDLIPQPVVQHISKDKSVVYVLNGNTTSNKLFVYDIDHKNRINSLFFNKDDKVNIKLVDIIERLDVDDKDNKGISMPVVDSDNNVFFIKDNKLTHYNWKTKETIPFTSNKYSFNEASLLLVNANLDKNNSTIHVLDHLTENNNKEKKIVGINFKDNSFEFDYEQTLAYSGLKRELSLSQTGDFYLFDGDDKIICLSPTKFKADILDLETIKPRKTYVSNNTLSIKENCTINTKTNFISKKIILKKGLTIKKGAQLTFKTLTDK